MNQRHFQFQLGPDTDLSDPHYNDMWDAVILKETDLLEVVTTLLRAYNDLATANDWNSHQHLERITTLLRAVGNAFKRAFNDPEVPSRITDQMIETLVAGYLIASDVGSISLSDPKS